MTQGPEVHDRPASISAPLAEGPVEPTEVHQFPGLPFRRGDPEDRITAYLAYLAHGQTLVGLTRGGIGLAGLEVNSNAGSGSVRSVGGGIRETDQGRGGEGLNEEEIRRNERERVLADLRDHIEEAVDQRIEEVVGQRIEEATRPLNERIQTLETQVTELHQERDQLQAQLQERDDEIARLNARIAELEGGTPPPNNPPDPNQPLTPEQLQQLQTELGAARNTLIDETIRSRATGLGRFLLGRWQRRRSYNEALTSYRQLLERVFNHERAERIASGENEDQIFTDQVDDLFNEREHLAQDVHTTNQDHLNQIIDDGGWRGRWANVLRFWGNQPTSRKVIFGVVSSAGLAVAAGTAGLGLGLLIGGGIWRFSLTYLNNRASVNNVPEHTRDRQVARIQRERRAFQPTSVTGNQNQRRARLLEVVFERGERGVTNRAERRNMVGTALMIGGLVLEGLAAVDVHVVPSILDAVGGHHHSPSATSPNHPSGQPSGGSGLNPNQTPSSGLNPNQTPPLNPNANPGSNGVNPNQAPTNVPNTPIAPQNGGLPQGGNGYTAPSSTIAPGITGNQLGQTSAIKGTHVEFWPDHNGGTYDNAAVRLVNGDHFVDHGIGHVDIVGSDGVIKVKDATVTQTGALSNKTVLQYLDSGVHRIANQHFWYEDKTRPGPIGWVQHTISQFKK